MAKLQVHAHTLVASVAVNAAYELYEELMRDNQLYEAWRRQHPGLSSKGLALAFVKKNSSKCVGIARATLAALIRDPTISPEYKEEIMEALVLDSTLMKGRADPAQIIGTTTGETPNG